MNIFKKKSKDLDPVGGLVGFTSELEKVFSRLGRGIMYGDPLVVDAIKHASDKTFKVHIRYTVQTESYKNIVNDIDFIKQMLHPDTKIEFFPETNNLLDDIDTARRCDCIITRTDDQQGFTSILNNFEAFYMYDFHLDRLVKDLKLFINLLSA